MINAVIADGEEARIKLREESEQRKELKEIEKIQEQARKEAEENIKREKICHKFSRFVHSLNISVFFSSG